MKKGTRSTRTAYLTGHTSRNEPNVGVRDATQFASDSEDYHLGLSRVQALAPAACT